MRIAAALLLHLMLLGHARAHDQWSNGAPVPGWVKTSCCGEKDVHHLTPDEVWRDDAAYHVKYLSTPIPIREALPSQDGDYWVFYTESEHPVVHCFFVPMEF